MCMLIPHISLHCGCFTSKNLDSTLFQECIYLYIHICVCVCIERGKKQKSKHINIYLLNETVTSSMGQEVYSFSGIICFEVVSGGIHCEKEQSSLVQGGRKSTMETMKTMTQNSHGALVPELGMSSGIRFPSR